MAGRPPKEERLIKEGISLVLFGATYEEAVNELQERYGINLEEEDLGYIEGEMRQRIEILLAKNKENTHE